MTDQRGHFSGLGFVLAAAGSAIGLGNIWKFPYITFANNGGSFVLIYLASVLLIAAPIMFAEILIGRKTQQSPVSAFVSLSKEVAGGKLWTVIGYLGVLTGFVILSYYSVVAGWTVYYFGKCLNWSLNGFSPEIAANLGTQFGAFVGNGKLQLLFHGLFIAVTMAVVTLGVKRGIERINKILMPLLIGILTLMCIASIGSPGFGEAIRFLFHAGPIHMESVLEAVGHSFFTLSLGMGALITYGSYMGRKEPVRRAAIWVCVLDTVIGLMACIVMFSIIFSVPLAERGTTFGKSAAILFTTLPRMLYEMPLGFLLAPTFFVLIGFAALTSTISLMEVVVSYFIDQRKMGRKAATAMVGGVIFVAGALSALSNGAVASLSNWTPFTERDKGVFGVLDYLASNWMLPIGGLLLAIFAGWILSEKLTRHELEDGDGHFKLYPVWRFLLRYVCPAAIGWILFAVIRGQAFN